MGWLSGTPRKAVVEKATADSRRHVSKQRSAAREMQRKADRLAESGDHLGSLNAADKAYELHRMADLNEGR